MSSSISAIIRIFAFGIFAGSAIMLSIGGLMVFSGAATDSGSLVRNGWGMIGVGVALFVLAIIAWVIVKISED